MDESSKEYRGDETEVTEDDSVDEDNVTFIEGDSGMNGNIDHDTDPNKRIRKPTDKGREWQISVSKSNVRSSLSAWRKCAGNTTIVLSDSCNVNVLKDTRQRLQACADNASSCFNGLSELTDIAHTSPELMQQYEAMEFEHLNLMKQLSDQIRDISDTKSQSSARSHASNASQRSDAKVKAAALRAKLKFIDLEAQSKAEYDRIKTLQALHVEESKMDALNSHDDGDFGKLPEDGMNDYVDHYLQSHEKFFKTEPQPIPATVSMPVSHTVTPPKPSLVSSDIKPSINPSNAKGVDTYPTHMNPSAPEFTPSAPPDSHSPIRTSTFADTIPKVSDQSSAQLAKAFADQISLNRLPPPEPGIFSGDPIQYPTWKVAFQILIEGKHIPASERLYYLKRYVAGPVKEAIDGFSLLSSGDVYEEVKSLLDERYGNPFTIACAFRERLEGWPKISPRDSQGLLKFSDFLRQCLFAMKTNTSLQVLDDSFENRKLLTKVPEWLVTRWNRRVVERKVATGSFPPFKDFVDFVSSEAKIANDPITSVGSLRVTHSDTVRNQGRKDFEHGRESRPFRSPRNEGKAVGRTLLSDTVQGNAVDPTKKRTISGEKCCCCNSSHELDDCAVFMKQGVEQRKEFIKKNGLCFGCLRTGHRSRKCRQRRTCRTCSKLHPTSLHGANGGPIPLKGENDNKPPSQMPEMKVKTGSVLMSRSGDEIKCSSIVPVYISHSSDPGSERLVYALLDSQSDTTFIREDTYRSLGLSGTPVKLSLSTMLAEDRIVECHKVQGLIIRGLDSDHRVTLPDTYTRNIMPANREHIPTPSIAREWPHLDRIASNLLPLNPCEIGLLIGYNCSEALMPLEIIPPQNEGPYGQRTILGWSIVGVVRHSHEDVDSIGVSHRIMVHEVPSNLSVGENSSVNSVMFSLKTSVKEVIGTDVLKMLERDFNDVVSRRETLSLDDQKFLSILNEGICISEGKYEMPLPFRHPKPTLPNNRAVAVSRLKSLQRRFRSDEVYQNQYFEFMSNLITKGYAERAKDQTSNDDTVWYIPHHGVYHPQKPNKLRVVFDCSATFQGHSLNQVLLQGPDLTNRLVGVLCRFRKESVGFMCDIEQMFYQFKVAPECQDYLRFLWWESNDYSLEPVDYQMKVHLFGATSSPGCANFGLKRLASDHELTFGSDVLDFIHNDFYVDDGVKSVPTDEEAISLITRTRDLCNTAGIRLHKFVSNSNQVMETIPPNERANGVKTVELLRNDDLVRSDTLIERALGMSWCIESDTFRFRVVLKDRPLTRRGILSSVSCLYDPLGLIAPVILRGKQILQQMCADKLDWDDPLPENLHDDWLQWRRGLEDLSSLATSRCLKPNDFGKVSVTEMHHFSDASSSGYGQCSYLRLVSETQQVHCTLLMGKSRVIPLKPITIPRLELGAAVLSVKTASLLDMEMEFDCTKHFYWTDSKVVLGYIGNESRRFHVYVANRVQQIRDQSDPSQWNFVGSSDNPADIASRGAQAGELVEHSMWFKGPEFLWQQNLQMPLSDVVPLNQDDPEIKKSQCFVSDHKTQVFATILERLQYFSSWFHAKRAIALCLRWKAKLRQAAMKDSKLKSSKDSVPSVYITPSVEELQCAETEICRHAQLDSFQEEMSRLKSLGAVGAPIDRKEVCRRHVALKSSSSLGKLDPFVDSNGVLRVGGRLQNSEMSSSLKHPILMPKLGHVTELLVRHFHESCHHQGRGITTNEIRQNGFWVIGCSSVVSTLLSKCRFCRRLRAAPQTQKMADLPSDRLEPAPPFTYCAVDLFGPFFVKEGRKEMKRYGVLFTCMSCRAIHIETTNSLESDSFINALRRFISIRGPIRQLRSDRGTNFVGADNELRKEIGEMDEDKIRAFLLEQSCDYVQFRMNVPMASHMGGVWERQIRSVRNVLAFLLQNNGSHLNDESLRTFLSEAAAIVNCRPLTVENLHDPESLIPLTPNQLLTLKSKVVLPPPGNFQKEDIYSRKHWRRTQYLVDQFWSRWKHEFLQNLQGRQKWVKPRRNLTVGDIVIIKDDNLPRNQWKLGKLIETTASDDGLVRKVKLVVADSVMDNKGKRKGPLPVLERPIHKVILLHETEEIPVEEP